MIRKITILTVVVVAVAGAVLFWLGNNTFSLPDGLNEIKKSTGFFVDEIKKEIINPPPLRAIRESQQSTLTQAGTIKWTNVQRANNGLALLAENVQLNTAVSRKVQDMFSRQYFEHVSPDGKNIGDLVETMGYEYIAVGENLALGNYKNDHELVRAWMDSPGHRANILNSRFREIGVAVGKGLFDGKQTWLAVQAFALPLAACPQTDQALKSQINWLEIQITELKVRADALLSEMEGYKKKSNREEYNKRAGEYNAIAQQINSLVAQVKNSIIKYNEQVRVFNACVAEL